MKHKLLTALLVTTVSAMACLGCGGGAKKAPAAKKDGVNWPTKPVQLVVPFTAGGDTDYNARVMAKYLEKKLGKPFTVTNVVGGGGAIADNRVKNAANDGYTILVNHVTLNLSAASKVIDYNFKEYEMGCVFASCIGDALLVRGDSPWNSVKDMIEDTKAHPGKYKIAANTGTTSHYVAISLQNAGAKFNVVDSGGSADRLVALLGGHVDVIPASLPAVKDYLKTGKLKALAVLTPNKVKLYSQYPTLKESGVDCAYTYNYTMFFPKGTNPAIAEKLAAAIKDIVDNDKNYAAEIKKAYLQDPFCMNRADSTKHWDAELANVMKISDKLQGKITKEKK